ncbi:MAG: DUF3570 domain-containing protein [Candidatus Eisenbacteria bacterium]|uniref:DUF3570 domain-containing protein n=1 Tax=Eiseniibacteriota bacterium TaxID=2212470 RepID=A0A933SBX6_UNCEI|nr:DUF3570 domain-containing protein [Candidatus Eisenbacteria bacterium]
MQLTDSPVPAPSPLRAALRGAALALLAGGAVATTAAASDVPRWQLDTSGLLYGELQRTSVVEPMARVTRTFAKGNSFTAQVDFDAITGASPSGAQPSGLVQTTTTPSGNTKTVPAGKLPLTDFRDMRGAVDLEYAQPFGSHLTASVGGHFSKESDYRSLGERGQLSLEAFQRLSTFTLGASANADVVTPLDGTREPFTADDRTGVNANDKHARSWLVGTSRVMTRRWLLGATGTYGEEWGYLTDPYKVVSTIDPLTGHTTGELHEKRPDRRVRRDVLLSSVYHHTEDVSYLSYRYYWDDWGVEAHTADFRLRHDFDASHFVQPHLRFSRQGAADFYCYGLVEGREKPRFATSDYRLGDLNTATVGVTYGFDLVSVPGQLTVRGEYMRQWGRGFPGDAVGSQRTYNLAPAVNTGTLMLGWSVGW